MDTKEVEQNIGIWWESVSMARVIGIHCFVKGGLNPRPPHGSHVNFEFKSHEYWDETSHG